MKVARKIASQVHCKGGCSNSTNLQEVLRFMSYRFYERDDRLEAKKRRKRRVDFVKAKCAKRERERESHLGVRRSVLCFSNQMISFNSCIFRKSKGFYGLRGLSKTN